MAVTVREAWVDLDSRIARRESEETLSDEAGRLAASFYDFAMAAWPIVVPMAYVETPHVRALCDHAQAAMEREIERLLVTIPPGSLKSTVLSVLLPAWRWAVHPQERLLTASHADDLATRDTRKSRALMQTRWFQERWPVEFSGDENLKTRYSNTVGGHRIRTHVGGGTGDRGSVLILDDPHNAKEAYSELQMQTARDWWSDTWASRLDDSVDVRGTMIVIGQRISPDDLIQFILDNDTAGRWTHLCLPEDYESKHPYVTPAKRKLPSGRVLQGDVRKIEGELLAPKYMDADRLEAKTIGMTARVYAGQYQQRPAPKEGNLLKRALWRYYNPAHSFYSERELFTPAIAKLHLPKFEQIVHSWDTSVKDRAKSDFVAGGVWGIREADRWLLRLFHQRIGLNATVAAMIELAEWADEIWPNTPQRIIIESAANGPDAIREIRGRVQGVEPWAAVGPKYQRAEAAAPALDGRNLFVPGWPTPEEDSYDPRTPTDVQDFIEELAAFDQAVHDDHVDQWSMMVNWSRARRRRKGKASRATGRLPRPTRLPS